MPDQATDLTFENFQVIDSSKSFNKAIFLSESGKRERNCFSAGAVLCDRAKEIEVLEKIYKWRNVAIDKNNPNSNPLKDVFKEEIHRDLDHLEENFNVFSKVINSTRPIVSRHLYSHVHRDNNGRKESHILATQWAILIDKLLGRYLEEDINNSEEDLLIIVPGGKEQVKRLWSSLVEIRPSEDHIPSLTYCVRGHMYYPCHLLAKLLSFHYMNLECEGDTNSGLLHDRDYYDDNISGQIWRDAMAGASKPRRKGFSPVSVKSFRGDHEAQRIFCWKKGATAPGPKVSEEVDKETVRNQLEELVSNARKNEYYGIATLIEGKYQQV